MRITSLITCCATLCTQGVHTINKETVLASQWFASHAYMKAVEKSPMVWPPTQLPVLPSSYLVSLFTHMLVVTALPRDKHFNPLMPNDHYSGRTTLLTSKRCILYIYSTNTGTEYFKCGIYSPFFFSSKCSLFHNSNVFGSCFIHILYTECAKI